ncbi:DUF4184 family protein [Nocardia yamanashiensis]|uniref:DUF4184 family protein n=1 Tax=Nocardia yamanashiensis TaxID=209247 RepID=UPI001E352064|nr:DUF4184 family protein [Nocardia yamanashiensis]UGT41391.1 DUF4184 family protein [Nocardia yamanashiensis]
MPFTLAHPAAALPLRHRLPLPGLIAGTLAPDVVYYLPISMPLPTHSLAGTVTSDLTVGLLLLAALFGVAADPLTALAPDGWRRRIREPEWDVRQLPRLAAAVVAGAITHVCWDSLVQRDGALVARWPWLRSTVIEPHKLYNVLGYLSSIGGLLALAFAAAGWYRRTPPGPPRPGLGRGPRRWVLGGTGVFVAFGVTHALTAYVRSGGYDLVRAALVGAIRWGAVAFAIYAVAWHLVARRADYLSRLTTWR